MNSEQFVLLRIPSYGRMQMIPLTEKDVSERMLAGLLETDVTERMRVPAVPDSFPPDAVLCYFIDARGGERELPVNFIGTCFYHTGCPIYGDLILAICAQDSDLAAISGFTKEQYQTLADWLTEQFGSYLDRPENLS